jgi:hypothetical protein
LRPICPTPDRGALADDFFHVDGKSTGFETILSN